VVHEAAPPVDLHDRDPLPVRLLEPGIAVDRDLPQLEAELVLRPGHDAAGGLAEVAARGGVEDDPSYG
jgi:hemolysin activation/secretion protein